MVVLTNHCLTQYCWTAELFGLSAGFSMLGIGPEIFIVVIVVLLVLLLIAGFVIWRLIFANNEKQDFSHSFKQKTENAPPASNDPVDEKLREELSPKTVSSSADTVNDKSDRDMREELSSDFSSQPTVDAMGDVSISSDDSDEDINLDEDINVDS